MELGRPNVEENRKEMDDTLNTLKIEDGRKPAEEMFSIDWYRKARDKTTWKSQENQCPTADFKMVKKYNGILISIYTYTVYIYTYIHTHTH